MLLYSQIANDSRCRDTRVMLMHYLRLLITDLPNNISFSEPDKYALGQQINCSADGNPGPESYRWTDLKNIKSQVPGQTLDLTEE